MLILFMGCNKEDAVITQDNSMYKDIKFFRGVFAFSKVPQLGQTAELNFTVNPISKVSNVNIQFSLPEKIQLLNGSLTWDGDIVANTETKRTINLKIAKTGNYEIKASVTGLTSEGGSITERYYIFLKVTETGITIVDSLPPTTGVDSLDDGDKKDKKIEDRGDSSGDYFDIKVFRSDLSISNTPLLNQTFNLTLALNPVMDVSVNTKIKIPNGVNVISGELDWNGVIKGNDLVSRSLLLKAVKAGYYEFTVTTKGKTSEGDNIRQEHSSIFISVSETSGEVSKNLSQPFKRETYNAKPITVGIADNITEKNSVYSRPPVYTGTIPTTQLSRIPDIDNAPKKTVNEKRNQEIITSTGEDGQGINKTRITKSDVYEVKIQLDQNPDIRKQQLEFLKEKNIPGPDKDCDSFIIEVNQAQLDGLKESGFKYEVTRQAFLIEGRNIPADSVITADPYFYGTNGTNVSIPDAGSWVFSAIDFSSLTPPAMVTTVDIHFEVIHTYIGDLVVTLDNAQRSINMWNREGGSADNINRTYTGVTNYTGDPANQIWRLWARDYASGGTGYIDHWWIKVYYQTEVFQTLVLPDLRANYTPSGWSAPIVVSPVSLTTIDGTIYAGQTAYIDWAILNDSTVPATGTFYIALYIDDIYITEWSGSNLNGGYYAFVKDYQRTFTAGNHTLKIKADYKNNIAESNENNNEYSRTITVIANQPDLIVEDIELTPSAPIKDSPCDIKFRVRNIGGQDINTRFYTRMYIDNSEVPTAWYTDSLSVGSAVEGTYSNTGDIPAGSHTIRVVTDTSNVIAEINENNNERSEDHTWVASSADLITVKGRWVYYDDNLSTLVPIRYATVLLYDDEVTADELLGTKNTDANGDFQFDPINNDDGLLQGGRDLYVRILFETAALYITNDSSALYVADTGVMNDVVIPANNIIDFGNVGFDSQNQSRGLGAIFTYVLDEYQWLADRVGWTRSQVKVKWPSETWPHSHGNEIHIPLLDSYGGQWAFDRGMILHEYAHCIMYTAYGNTFPTGTGPDPHYINSVSSGGFSICEGWAEFMSASVDNDANDTRAYSMGDVDGDGIANNVVTDIEDSRYTATNGSQFKWFHSRTAPPNNDGNIVEGAVAQILWDIFDSSASLDNETPNTDDDSLALGINNIWNIVLNDRPNSINVFWDRWFARNYGYQAELCNIYADHGINHAPTLATFAINSGAASTTSQTVTLNNTATCTPTQYMASENSSFTGASWLAYSTAPSFTLSAGCGVKTVYLKLKNATGESNTLSDTIDLITTPVLNTFAINSGAASTTSQTVTLNNTATCTPTQYMASENSSFTGASWLAYSTAPSFTLSAGCGVKTVYLKLKNATGESNTLNDTIDLITTPVLNTFAINSGAASTTSQTVTLNNTATCTPTQYMASESSSFTGASWLAYSTAPSFTLSAGGIKTVYLKLKNATGESNTMNDSIDYLSQISVTVTTNIGSGTTVIVDGVTQNAPYTITTWVSGSSHTIGISSPQSGGTDKQYVYQNWSDGGSQSHTVSPTSNTTYTAALLTQLQISAKTTPPASANVWNIVGPSVITSDKSIVKNFGEAGFGTTWIAWRWNPTSEIWEVPATVGSNPITNDPFDAGTSWFYALDGDGFDVTKSVEGTQVDTSTPFSVPLKAGWNLICNPFDFSVAWSDSVIKIKYGGIDYTPTDAKAANYVDNRAIWYNPNTRAYVTRYSNETTPYVMLKTRGQWLYSLVNDASVVFSPTESPLAPPSKPEIDSSLWKVELIIRSSKGNDIVEAIADNKEQVGLHDIKAPSLPISTSSISFVRDDNELSSDRQKESNEMTWTFEVNTSEESSLGWKLMGIPDDYRLILEDETGKQIDIRQMSILPIGKVEKKSYILKATRVLAPKVTRLLANYPNPFNPDTWIPYQLSEGSEVVIKIYTSAGNLVRTLNLGRKETGYYTTQSQSAHWDGKNEYGELVSSGAYFYSIKTDRNTFTRKMIVLK
jgi:subtilisin-like proprotein convertase family protein